MANGSHPPAELHERLLICRTIKLNAGAHGGHRRCCHAQIQKNAQNKPQIARLILCVHTTLQVYCNLFLTFCANFVILLIFLIVYCWIMLPIGLSEAGRVFVRPINPKLEFHEVA